MRLSFIARRNLTRHVSTTIQNSIGVMIPVFIVSFLFSIIAGMENDVQTIITKYLAGDVRVRNMEFSKNEVFNLSYFLVENVSEIEQVLSTLEGVDMVRAKLRVPVTMINGGSDSGITEEANNTSIFEPLQMVGLEFEKENNSYNIESFLKEGQLPQTNTRQALIGSETATLFNIKVGDIVTFMGPTALRGSNGMSVTVVGIIHYPVGMFNVRTLYLPLNTAQDFFRSPNAATEINITKNPLVKISSSNFQKNITSSLDTLKRTRNIITEFDIAPWNKISSFAQIVRIGRIIYFIIGAFFCFLGSLVIYNTVYISLYNRRYEMGVLNANGFTIPMLQRIMKYEVLYTVILGTSLGMIISLVFISWLGRVGLDLALFGNKIDSNTLMTPILYPSLSAFWTTLLILYSTLVCYMVGIAPIRSLKKTTPLSLLKSD